MQEKLSIVWKYDKKYRNYIKYINGQRVKEITDTEVEADPKLCEEVRKYYEP